MIKILIFDLSCIYSVSDAVTSLGIVNYRYHTNLCLLPSYNSFHKMNLFSSTKLININCFHSFTDVFIFTFNFCYK